MFVGWCEEQARGIENSAASLKRPLLASKSRRMPQYFVSIPINISERKPFCSYRVSPCWEHAVSCTSPHMHVWNKAWLKITLPQLFFSAKEIARHVSAAFRRPTNLIKSDLCKGTWPEFVVAQMIFGVFSGPQPHPTANFGHSKYTGLSFPSYTAIFQN